MMYMIQGCNFDQKETIVQSVADKNGHPTIRSFEFTSGRKRMTSFSHNHDDY